MPVPTSLTFPYYYYLIFLLFYCRTAVEADNDIGLMFMDGGRESLEFFRDYNGPLLTDGTFFVTPKPFNSLLTVHLQYGNHTFPLFFFLLPKRTEAMYRSALLKVAETLAPLNTTITHCMTDFEMALMKACESVFNVQTRGCWFHFSQALYKKVRSIGLLHRFRRDGRGQASEFQKLIHCYMALPLLPADEIDGAMRSLHVQVVTLIPEEQRRLLQFQRYMTTFWLQKITPPRMSVYGFGRRSNNAIESFNATLKRKVKSAHPNIFVFIEHLNNLILSKLADLRTIQNAQRLTRRPPRQQLSNEEKLRNLEESLSRGVLTPVAFLQKACATFHRYVDAIDLSDDDQDEDANQAAGNLPGQADATQEEAEENRDSQVNGARTDEGRMCPICMLTPRNAVINPCGHSACFQCAHTLHNMNWPGNKCHECRGQIISIIRVFGMNE